jgi:hypothetical protein
MRLRLVDRDAINFKFVHAYGSLRQVTNVKYAAKTDLSIIGIVLLLDPNLLRW